MTRWLRPFLAALLAASSVAAGAAELVDVAMVVDPAAGSVIGQIITLKATVTVSGAPDELVSTGTIDFSDADPSGAGRYPLCTGVPLVNGTATCTDVATMHGGPRYLLAEYKDPSGTYQPVGTFIPSYFVGTPAAPLLTRQGMLSMVGQATTFTLGLTQVERLSGTVEFLEGANVLCTVFVLDGGTASCTTSTLAIGDHWIWASYGGDGLHPAVAAGPILHVVLNTPRAGMHNVALASTGAVPTSSNRTESANYPLVAAIDGDRIGANWSHGGGWLDDFYYNAPKWYQVQFAGAESIDSIVVYTVQDTTPLVEPSDETRLQTQADYYYNDFTVQAWDGVQWVTVGSAKANPFVKRTFAFPPIVTDRVRVTWTNPAIGYARLVELEVNGVDTAGLGSANMALATAGATVYAWNTYGPGFEASGVIDGERAGVNWTHGGGWADGTLDTYPDALRIDFPVDTILDKIVVYSVQDNWQAPAAPTAEMTCSLYCLLDYSVSGLDIPVPYPLASSKAASSAASPARPAEILNPWIALGSVTGNDRVMRSFEFAPLRTRSILVNVTDARMGLSRITEVEAYGARAAPSVNVALASAGASVAASSMLDSDAFPPSAVIDGDRTGANWTRGGGWADATLDAYPDWLQITFSGIRVIQHVNVYTVQDNWQSPVEPTDTLVTNLYGLQDFSISGWDGQQWVKLGSVKDNNLVKCAFDFDPFATQYLRVEVTRARGALSRITEVEAWTKGQ